MKSEISEIILVDRRFSSGQSLTFKNNYKLYKNEKCGKKGFLNSGRVPLVTTSRNLRSKGLWKGKERHITHQN